MNPSESRIQQFEKMAHDDPNNELGHFSLGKAYLEADRFEEAAASLKRALDLNPTLSKAYELIAVALDGAGQRETAVEFLTRGVEVADERGDRKPRDAMADMLRRWGRSVPAFKESAAGAGTAARAADAGRATGSATGFQCCRCGRPSGQLEKAPFKGDQGRRIYENVCQFCWREWIAMGTKVINELGLVMANPKDQATYDQYMFEFLQLET